MTVPSTEWDERQWTVALKADDHMYRAMLDDMARIASRQHTSLPPRERQYLERIATGMTLAEVAADLGVARATVKATLETARQRLGAVNTTHAVAIALGEGVIDAPQRNPR